ncbi:hypothetical protein HMF8227_02751 [Saliniradius amylolyticus]|uniref:Pilus assembly protein PilP n=1 Tax=Saliniradius amylolyticus TaxID=2183582 RepID=A0A2S2E6P4_9ALTE|nr:pilus assembly protein PilP [Saliniradius amylolyticus]AWL13202.1 hypothetical protein HMF8227_02751 [Saliniradius amylolyticus]
MKWLVIPLMLLLTGCQAEKADLKQFVAEVKQTTRVSIEPYPEFSRMPAFEYDAYEQRNPFTRPGNQGAAQIKATKANCRQPDFSRSKGPLEQYGTDALNVKGFFTNPEGTWALIQANDGSLHKATVGDRLGLFFGRITDIANGQITIIEMLPDGTGCWQEKTSTLAIGDGRGEK